MPAAKGVVSMREDVQEDFCERKRGRNVTERCLSVAILAILISSAVFVFPMLSGSVSAEPITITIGSTEAIDTFNPFSAISGTTWMIIWEMYETFVTRDPTTLQPIPMLAQSWDTSPDGKVWTFHLVQNSTWHDNIPVVAEDVNWTFNFIKSHPTECSFYLNYVQNMTEIVALDDYTVRFTTDVPKAIMLALDVPILPKHLWSAVPLQQLGGVDMWNTRYFPNGPIGSGPMILSSFSRTLGDIWMLKWDNYHMGTINVDKVLYKLFTSEDAMMNALYSGSIDVAMLVPTNLWEKTLNTEGVEGQVADELDMHHLGFNCASPSLRLATDSSGKRLFPKASTHIDTCNTSVRQAVAMAVNKTQLVTEVLNGLADEASVIIPPITPYWRYTVPENEEFKFDPEKAKALLDAAGYDRDDDRDGIRENRTSGAELNFDFYYSTQYTEDGLAAQKISNWLRDIGINAPAIGVSENVLYSSYQLDMKYDMFFWSWWPNVDPDWILSVLTTDQIMKKSGDWSTWSDTFYSNPTYDQLYLQQQNAVNITQRQTIVREMQKIVYHDSPYIFMWNPYGLYGYRVDRFENFPNFKAHPLTTPANFWFFFEITPRTGNMSPEFKSLLNPTYWPIVNRQQTFQVEVRDADNDMLWVNWTFGDGAVAHDVVPAGSSYGGVILTQSHTYTTLNWDPGYNMTVSVTDGQPGHDKVTTAIVYVIEKPDAAPTFTSLVTSSPPSEAYNDSVVRWFVNASDGESGGPSGFGLRFTWVWDDGQITVSNHQPIQNNKNVMDTVTHSWSSATTYSVRVWVWDGSDYPGHNVSSSIISFKVKENTPPATPNIPSISGTEGTWVNCVATSVDADPDPLRITWVWDDGTFNVTNHAANQGVQITSSVQHKWPVTGTSKTYPVTVWVDDLTGYPGHNVSATIDATVEPVGANVPPTALLITPSSPPHYVNANLVFNTSAIDTDGDALEFYFEFGDGASAVATLPAGVTTTRYVDFSHSYAAPNTYTVTLWVNDSTGPANHNSTATVSIDVIENEPPVVGLPSSLTAGYNRTFTVTPTQCQDNDGDPLKVWYDWGDGSPMTQGGDLASSYAASHVYSSLGNKTLTVYVDDGTGLTGHNVSATATVKVFEANLKPEIVGVIEKTPSKASYLPDETITFSIVVRDFEGDNMTLTVEFGDGTQQVVDILGVPVTQADTNITKNVTHAYAAARVAPYSVNATVKDDMDHADTQWSVGLTVVQVTAPPEPPSEEFPLALAAGVSIAVVLAILATFLLLRRRKKGAAGVEGEPPPPPGPS